jgi:uncharacterized membrane protein
MGRIAGWACRTLWRKGLAMSGDVFFHDYYFDVSWWLLGLVLAVLACVAALIVVRLARRGKD